MDMKQIRFQNLPGLIEPPPVGHSRSIADETIQHREMIRNRLIDIFALRTANGLQQWGLELVEKLENQLFMNAASLAEKVIAERRKLDLMGLLWDEYINQETLRFRLQIIFYQRCRHLGNIQTVVEFLDRSSHMRRPITSGQQLGYVNSLAEEVNSIWFNDNSTSIRNASNVLEMATPATATANTNQFNIMNGFGSIDNNELQGDSAAPLSSDFMTSQHAVPLENPNSYSLFPNENFSQSSNSLVNGILQSISEMNQTQIHQPGFPLQQTLPIFQYLPSEGYTLSNQSNISNTNTDNTSTDNLEDLLRSSKRAKTEKENYLCSKHVKTSNKSFQTPQQSEVDNEIGIKLRSSETEGGLSMLEISTTREIKEHVCSPKVLRTSAESFQTQQQLEFDNGGVRAENQELNGLQLSKFFNSEKIEEYVVSNQKCVKTIPESFQTQQQELEVDHEEKIKAGSPNISGLSQSEYFATQQIEEHTSSTKYTAVDTSRPKCIEEHTSSTKCVTNTKSFQTQLGLEVDREEGIKPGSREIKSTSMLELFTTEQIREHISSFNQNNMDKEKVGDDSKCQLCGLFKLILIPEPKHCSCCYVLIKRGTNYYLNPNEDSNKYFFCTSCYKKCRKGKISIHGVCISKETLRPAKNEAEILDPWVQCDKCDGWQHQICGLFNAKSDLEGKTKYVCPKCLLKDMESGDYRYSSNSAVFGAKDLPQTKLSDHIERRLFRRLKEEREEIAKVTGKYFNEVQGANDLVVRVVSCIKKKVNVKKQLLDILEDKNYPVEFPFTSKLILLFQKVGGADVCIFAIYVQEFGSECSPPNQRSVYISYIDSVKYFVPNIQTATTTKEALRTFVYHEILIGYLDFIKKRGFATCYIWACPPLKGDDYIFHCHPKTQKTPKPEKLRQWYHSVIGKAANENIVVDFTSFYNHFFNPTGERDFKITAVRLPCFEGDYCSRAIEDILTDIENKCPMKTKPVTKRNLQFMGHKEYSDANTKDIKFMQKLEQAIIPVKEDFLVIHLHYVCTHCHEPILSGIRWSCSQCKNFHLCER
ncbi:Histone acetyltransferase Rtt109/CBP [Trema orientale]|uniref:histone acetyltransferase n=1 Tax=Trema orientale TaxID=63057 RepID=A0A2P5ECC2_TREOI|nr:Histone acetyltransferase Rtt109/CBP [Trema orientale]